jgi:hypothetical protein
MVMVVVLSMVVVLLMVGVGGGGGDLAASGLNYIEITALRSFGNDSFPLSPHFFGHGIDNIVDIAL